MKSEKKDGDGRSSNGAKMTPEHIAKMQAGRKKVYVETSLTCNVCAARGTCRAFKAGSVCTIVDTFRGYESKQAPDVMAKLQEIISALEIRYWQNVYFEQLDGGRAKKEVTTMSDQLLKLYKLQHDLFRERDQSKGAVVLDPDSVLGKIFGMRAKRDEDERL